MQAVLDGEDLTGRPLLERKRRLKAIMPRIESRLLYLDHVKANVTAADALQAGSQLVVRLRWADSMTNFAGTVFEVSPACQSAARGKRARLGSPLRRAPVCNRAYSDARIEPRLGPWRQIRR